MKKAKRALSLILAASIIITVMSVGIVSAGAVKTDHGKYTPSAGVDTYKYYLAMPGCWINDSTHDNNDAPGCYWWDATDNPDDVFYHGWPGYEMDKEEGFDNLYSINAPRNAAALVFSNYIDGGMDSSKPEFSQALHCKSSPAEFYCDGDSYNYSPEFWEYMWTLAQNKAGIESDNESFDKTYDAIMDNPDVIDFTPEFGENGKVFFSETEFETGLAMRFDNMVWVVDLDPENIGMDYTIVPDGKPVFDGEWYFMYGNGEYGMWPTKDLALEQEGVTVDEEGNYAIPDNYTVDEYGTIRNADGYVVLGNFTGYYSVCDLPEKAEPTEPATEEVEPTEPVVHYTDPEYPDSVPDAEELSTYSKDSIYFYVPSFWTNYNDIRVYLYNLDTGDVLIPWNSKRGRMTDEGNGLWSFNLADNGHILNDNENYGCIFLTNIEMQTCDILIGNPCLGDTAFCPDNYDMVENSVDSNKKSYNVSWKNADRTQYAPPLTITSIGNVIGDALPKGQTKYDLLASFINGTSFPGLKSAAMFREETEQKIIDDIANALGLYREDVAKAVDEAYVSVDWSSSISTVPSNPVSVTYTVGDVNGDGSVNGSDAAILSRYTSGWEGYESRIVNMDAADINRDGKVNGMDAALLSRYTSGWDGYDKYIITVTA